MKNADTVLKEIAAGPVACFRGLTEDWKEFESCCTLFRQKHLGVVPCYWKALAGKLNAAELRGIRALYQILPEELDRLALSFAYTLSQKYENAFKSFLSARNLVRFESEREILRKMPKVRKSDVRIPKDKIAQIRSLYREFLEARVMSIDVRAGNYRITVMRNGFSYQISAMHDRLVEFFRILTDRDVDGIHGVDGMMTNEINTSPHPIKWETALSFKWCEVLTAGVPGGTVKREGVHVHVR